MIKKIILIWNTIRFLKPVQIYWRFWLRFYKPQPNLSPAPRSRELSRPLVPILQKSPSLELPNQFTFLNETHCLNTASDWNNPEWEKLWLYNLHYFDDLNAIDSKYKVSAHRQLINKWIADNKPVVGNGWEPYPASLRIVNWIKWALQGNQLDEHWIDSLAVQVRHLRNRLEYHLLGNHLFANAKALVFAGLYFEGKEANEWLNKGLEILDTELPEQILDDGGHFELSPMYHCIILEDILDLINLSRSYHNVIDKGVLGYWEDLVKKMLAWLDSMTHPDGQIALFNDAAFGIAASPGELVEYAKRLDIEPASASCVSKLLPSSGYARLENTDAVLLADVGRIGPEYLPGHAHADTLTFELSLLGQRVIVDSGTSCYGYSNERLRQRSTSAHNTVEVDGQNSSEVWGGFRVARRAFTHSIILNNQDNAVELSASHDGYLRLQKGILHYRTWRLEDKSVYIEDKVTGEFDKAIGRLLFAPDIGIESIDDSAKWLLTREGDVIAEVLVDSPHAEIVKSSYHPEFGRSLATNCLTYTVYEGNSTVVRLAWR